MANEKKLYCGQTDLPLSESGASEILRLTEEGIYPSADVFFTSGLLRTEQTLDLIFGGVYRKQLPDISEYKFGIFEMKCYEELKERSDYQAWISSGTGDIRCPGGESKNEFESRVLSGCERIISETQQAAADSAFIVCHGGVIACIMEYLSPGTRNFYEWQPNPGRGYTVRLSETEDIHVDFLYRLQEYKKI